MSLGRGICSLFVAAAGLIAIAHPVRALAEENVHPRNVVWTEKTGGGKCFKCSTNDTPCVPDAKTGACPEQTIQCLAWEESTTCPSETKKASKPSQTRATDKDRTKPIVFTLAGASNVKTAVAAANTRTCHRCLDWVLECVGKDKDGNCNHWKYRCAQWEDYPCN